MTTDQAKQLTEDALSRLMAALESGQSNALTTYLRLMSRFHRYSWGNCLLIYSQCPDAKHVAGFHSWLKMRRFVRKGEKAIVILAPMVGRKRTGDELAEDERTRLFGFRTAHIFDVSQTDGEALPAFATVKGSPGDVLDRLKSFVADKGIALDYSDGIKPARGISSGGAITLVREMSPAEEFAVLAHEIAHELLHRGDRRKGTTHTVRETEAEAVAFVICNAIGLDTNTSSSDYIQLHSGDKATLAESLFVVQHTASEILSALMPEIEVPN